MDPESFRQYGYRRSTGSPTSLRIPSSTRFALAFNPARFVRTFVLSARATGANG